MSHILQSTLKSLNLPKVFTLFQIGKKFLNIKCVLILELSSMPATFLILLRIHRDIKNVGLSSCKVPLV